MLIIFTSFQQNIACDLAKEYVLKTFNFENGSPEDLLLDFQQIYDRMLNVFKNQNTDSDDEIAKKWLSK